MGVEVLAANPGFFCGRGACGSAVDGVLVSFFLLEASPSGVLGLFLRSMNTVGSTFRLRPGADDSDGIVGVALREI